MKLRSALLAATVLAAAPVAAQAQAVSGIYIGAGAGVNFMSNQTVDRTSFSQGVTGNVTNNLQGSRSGEMGTGYLGVASIGYGLGNGLRLEVEGGFRQNRFQKLGGNSQVGVANFSGNENKYTGMVNVLYDIDPAIFGFGPIPVVPYVGVGAGYAWAQDQNARVLGFVPATAGVNNPFGRYQYRTNSGQGDFAYQGIVGVAFPIQTIPGLSLTAEYRFLGLDGDRTYNYQYASNRPLATGGATARASLRFNDDYNHSILVGVRYAFNAAPPPPPVAPVAAAPAREAARTYLVFFDWDKSDLTPRARQVVAEAAQATTRVQVTRIQVNGYTDTSGTPRYNEGLSVRRAQSVANELVRDGVPRGAISTQGFGETHLLVPTANGVREPQNRRVEIILQ